MFLNPRYGTIGLIVVPYYLFFEILGPVIEISGYVVVLLSWVLGLLNVKFLLLFLTLAVLYGIFLSTAGIFLEELTYRRYPQWRHLFRLLVFGVLENFGYRQMNAFWRLQAGFNYVRYRHRWEHVENKGSGRATEGLP
jgi:hypothetical protein